MTDWGSLLVPAAAALSGVVVTQLLTSRNEEASSRREDRQRTYEYRRAAVTEYILAANRAIDATRELVRSATDSPEHDAFLEDYHAKWRAMYERHLELLLLLPGRARVAVTNHVDTAFAWREQALAAGSAQGPPKNEALIEELHQWMHPGLPGE